MKRGDLVRFAYLTNLSPHHEEVGILLEVSHPKGREKPIAKVHWFSMKHPLQHLTVALEVISENR